MTRSQETLIDPELDADRQRPDPEVDDLLVGAVDLHVHPGPSPFPRRIGILDAARRARARARPAGRGARARRSRPRTGARDVLDVIAALPVTGYRRTVRRLLDNGVVADDIRAMVGGNARGLLTRGDN